MDELIPWELFQDLDKKFASLMVNAPFWVYLMIVMMMFMILYMVGK